MNAITLSEVTKTFRIHHQERRAVRDSLLRYLEGKGLNTEILVALDKISLAVEPGEFLGLIGPNGCGKSTLMRVIAGIYAPDAGSVVTSGQVMPLFELGIGFQPQLTARENIFLSGLIFGMSRSAIADRLEAIAEFSELAKFMDTQVSYFSTGMKVRLGFALAIQVEAPIILLDEILAVGDEDFQNKCEQELQSFREQGRTIVLASHSFETIEKWCSKAAYLNGGKLIAAGNPAEIIGRYQQDVRQEGVPT